MSSVASIIAQLVLFAVAAAFIFLDLPRRLADAIRARWGWETDSHVWRGSLFGMLIAPALTLVIASCSPDPVAVTSLHYVWRAVHLGTAVFYAWVPLGAAYRGYARNRHNVVALVQTYLCIALGFSLLYYVLVLGAPGASPFGGMATPWIHRPPLVPDVVMFSWPDALLCMVDCVHLSTVTITTLGFGDVHPVAWYAKALVDLEVLLGLGIIALGIGSYFSSPPRPQAERAHQRRLRRSRYSARPDAVLPPSGTTRRPPALRRLARKRKRSDDP